MNSINCATNSDLSKEMIEEGNRWLKEYKETVRLRQNKIGTLDLCPYDIFPFRAEKSTETSIYNIPFEFKIRLESDQDLGSNYDDKVLFGIIYCRQNYEGVAWKIATNCEIKMVNYHNEIREKVIKSVSCDFNIRRSRVKIPLLKWNQFYAENEDIVARALIDFIATIKIINVSSFEMPIVNDLTIPEIRINDFPFNINGIKIYVNKNYLAKYSSVFKTMFSSNLKEATTDEILLKDIFVGDFVEMLEVIYPSRKKISIKNIEILLKLADKYDIPSLISKCRDFVIKSGEISESKKMDLAQKYNFTLFNEDHNILHNSSHCLEKGALPSVGVYD
uniref:BTB domain-containing protein n=1 Tax=Parastrongyloides trichosuri TaxID=131310 RepID=A0A0N4Z4K0_PARTI